MSKNTKHKDYKRYLALMEKEDELEMVIKNLGYVELEKPIHKGYEAYLELREDITRRQDAWVFQYIIDNCSTITWSPTTVFYEKKRGYVIDRTPKIKLMSEEQYLKLPPQVAKYFRHNHLDDKPRWNGTVAKYYSASYVPDFYFVMKIRNSYITHRKVVDGELERELRFVRDQLFYLRTIMSPYNETGYSAFKKDINKRNRRKDKMALRKNLNTMFINDSHEWYKEQGVEMTEREFITDSDWTEWASSSAWSQDFYEFKYRPRNEAAWWYW
jgi:hypothetical protein